MLNPRKIWLALIFLSTAFGAGTDALGQELRLSVPEYLPYTGTVDGKPGGTAIETVREILKKAGMTMVVQVVPNYGRCIQQIKEGTIDGFFLGSRNSERDAIAELSDAVTVNNWVWVTRKASSWRAANEDFKRKAHVGVMLNTNPHSWLKGHGYNITGTATTSASLLAMLDLERLDAALMPELVFQNAVQSTSRSLGTYTTESEIKQPFGIYVSRKFIQAHPDVMARINQAIQQLRGRDGKARP
ncbi:MAG TPA: transporter substrate-binding domain-containing protein [Burkholderiaceae bacterium]|jgi:hypothetical protein